MSALAPVLIDNPKTSWSRLELSPEWVRLTPPQRVFVVEFLATGSAFLATKVGYRAKSEKNSRVLSYELAKNPFIVAAVDVATGRVRSEREILISEVQRQLKAAETGSIAATKLTAQLERLILGGQQEELDDEPANEVEPSSNSQKTIVAKVGDIVLVNGVQHRVSVVDENGRPTEGEPV